MASLEGWNFTIKLCPRWERKLASTCGTAKQFFQSAGVCYLCDRGLASRMRTLSVPVCVLTLGVLISARADLTIVQKVEGAGQNRDATVKIKGDKERVDSSGQNTQIIDGKTGEMINLMNDKKTFVKISAEQIKTAAETISKFNGEQKSTRKLTPTGKKETINGYETEEFAYETPQLKVSFWVATKYPGAAEILKEMQLPMSGAWKQSNMNMPDYTDFSGVPIKTVISLGGTEMTTTITLIKKDPINAAEFEIPKDFQEMKVPTGPAPERSAGSPSATP